MFTVKWIGSNGAQHIYAGQNISYTPPQQAESKTATVSFEIAGPENCHCIIDNGEVYVMNGNGKTVANYVLKTDAFPHGIEPRAQP